MYPFLENGTPFLKDKLARPNITIDLTNYVLHKPGIKRVRGELPGYFSYTELKTTPEDGIPH